MQLNTNGSHTPFNIKYDLQNIHSCMESQFTGITPTAAGLMIAGIESPNPVSYSRNKNFYNTEKRYKNQYISHQKVVKGVDQLNELGLITDHKSKVGQRGLQSYFEPTAKLLESCDFIRRIDKNIDINAEKIILRNEEKKNIDYKDTRETVRMRKDLICINEMIVATDIKDTVEGRAIKAPVRRIFNQSMKRGGRIYARGYSWQNMPKQNRREVTINGGTTCEYDYKSLHPAMLYEKSGLIIPSDCYDIDLNSSGVWWDRPMVKKAFNIMLNAKNDMAGKRAIAEAIRQTYPELTSDCWNKAAQLMNRIKECHLVISGHFNSDAGAWLMRMDSDIANKVMLDCINKDIPIFPVHDSFIVQERHGDILKESMLKAAALNGFNGLQVE